MLKRSLLGSAVLLASSYATATPFMPMDARGLAMGNTGVASAKLAHAPAYNPSLLSQAESSDDFALIFPQIGINVADEAELFDTADYLDEEVIPEFDSLFDDSASDSLPTAIDNLNAAADQLQSDLGGPNQAASNQALKNEISNTQDAVSRLNSSVNELDSSLQTISGNPVRGRLGLAAGLAVPNDVLSFAISARVDGNASARTLYSENDSTLLTSYAPAASGYLDAANALTDAVDDNNASAANDAYTALDNYTSDDIELENGTTQIFQGGELSDSASDPALNSRVQIVAIGIAEVGLSLSREFVIADKPVAIGITPKLQQVATYHYVGQVDEEDNAPDVELEDSERTSNHINLDIGTSFYVDPQERLRVGIVIQDLISKDFEYAEVAVDGDADGEVAAGGKVSLKPKLRAGVAYTRDWYNLAADLDLTENEALAFEDPTQYLSVGGEVDLAGWAQLRAGLRTNLAGESNVVSLGAGVSPFGVHFDLAAMMDISDPEKELGLALETGFYF